eukprot:5232243-Amphidinium_carterae.2
MSLWPWAIVVDVSISDARVEYWIVHPALVPEPRNEPSGNFVTSNWGYMTYCAGCFLHSFLLVRCFVVVCSVEQRLVVLTTNDSLPPLFARWSSDSLS